jgi:hypothetical protein
MTRRTPRLTHWTGIKRRCYIEKCDKRAKDFIDKKPLCRIHSPLRKGYKK